MALDKASFNSAYQAAFKAGSGDAKAAADASERGLTGDFCTVWPKVKKYIAMAIMVLAVFKPGAAAAVQAFVTAFEKTVLPVVCAPPAP